ncbi:MAG: DUF2282 domain-containing protein [Rhodospirillaceae bacterium]|nr:DUF2282 domain-containing protein [Rhodospirillaceae bacterium]
MIAGAVIGAAIAAGATSLYERYFGASASGSGEDGKEQCYGVAKAGENGCASANGSHTCGGLAKVDFSGQEWKLVEAGTCLKLGGKLEAFDNASAPDPAPAKTPG